MSEPTTEAGKRMLWDMGLYDPIIGKGRQTLAVGRILAIEAEAVARYKARLRERVEGMLDAEWRECHGDCHGHTLDAVLALIDGGEG